MGLLATLFALLAPALFGTPHIALSTSTSVPAGATAKPAASVKLFVDVVPDAKIRVYAPGAKDYLPVVLELSPQPGIRAGKLDYPPSQDWYFEPLKEHVPVYQAPFRLTQNVVVSAAAKSGQTLTVQGTFKYQACDDTICYNPATAPVSWTVNVK
jgi:hypothetical protein